MKISLSTLVNMGLATALVTSLIFLAVTSSSSQQYDPWVDFNEDGTIDIFDIVGVALAFGASGDSTKNVTVTNWPTKQVLNVSLADNLVIPEQSVVLLSVDVDRYDRVTLVINKQTSGTLMISVHFKIGGVYTPAVYANPSLPGGSTLVLQDWVVIGPTLLVELTTTDFAVTVSAGVFAAETSR